MKLIKTMILVLVALSLMSAVGLAQVDHMGKTDTVYADLSRINDDNWSITINVVNDENILGLSVPLKLRAANVKVVADSASYAGGRIEHFAYKGFRPDTVIQCVMLGMIANLGPSENKLTPGSGRIVTIFVSSLDGEKIEKLTVDTTTLSPDNSLMIVADVEDLADVNDSIPKHIDKRLEIYPAFVARISK